MIQELKMMTRRGALATAVLLITHGRQAIGQTKWPDKPIRIVVAFPPGGGVDVMARAMAEPQREVLGQPILIINKPGAGGVIAATDVIHAGPDGLTFLVGVTSQESIVPFVMDLKIDTAKDLRPVAAIARFQQHLVVRADSRFKDIDDLITFARQNPKLVTYGSAGVATPPHVVGELLMQRTGVQLTHVPYKGGSAALQALLGGEVDALFDPGICFPHVTAGKLRMLVVASGSRSPFFPAVPTTVEKGLKEVQMDMLTGIWAPAATPQVIVEQMASATEKVTATPAFQKRLGDMGAQPLYMPPAQFTKFVRDETKMLSELIKERKIRAE